MPARRDVSRRVFLGGTAAVAAALTSPGPAVGESPRRGGVLRVSAYLNPSSLDPYTGRSGADQAYLHAFYDTLVDFEPDTLKAKPGLASWSFPDPKTMVLDVKPGVVFHDGTPCDAEAVKSNIVRGMTAVRSAVKAEFLNVASVEVGGPLKVVMHLKQPDSALPLILSDRAGMMSSPTAIAAAGDDFDRRPCGTGLFKFEAWKDADRVVGVRNDNYWRPRTHLDGIVFRVITDYSAGARSVQAGENDFMWLVPPRFFSRLKTVKDVSVVRYPSVRIICMFFNYGRPPLDDVRVRQAINFAIDREGFARVTTDGTGDVASSLAPAQYWAFDPESAKRYTYDPDKARHLISAAGYGNGLELTLVTLPDAEYRRRADIIMENLKKVGMNVRLMPVQQASFTFTSERKGDLFLTAWTGRADLTQSYLQRFATSAFYNVSYAISKANPVENMDELLAATHATEDMPTRKAAFATLMRAEREQALFAPLCSEQVVYLYRTNVKGFVPNLMGKPKFDGVYLDS